MKASRIILSDTAVLVAKGPCRFVLLAQDQFNLGDSSVTPDSGTNPQYAERQGRIENVLDSGEKLYACASLAGNTPTLNIIIFGN